MPTPPMLYSSKRKAIAIVSAGKRLPLVRRNRPSWFGDELQALEERVDSGRTLKVEWHFAANSQLGGDVVGSTIHICSGVRETLEETRDNGMN